MKKTDSSAKRLLLDLLNGRQTLEGHTLHQIKPGSLVCLTGCQAGQEPPLLYLAGEGDKGYTWQEVKAKGQLYEGGVIAIVEVPFSRGDKLPNLSTYSPTF